MLKFDYADALALNQKAYTFSSLSPSTSTIDIEWQLSMRCHIQRENNLTAKHVIRVQAQDAPHLHIDANQIP